MKKTLIILAIVCSLLVNGCTLICANKSKIETILNGIIADATIIINTLSTQVPMPPEVAMILAAAMKARDVATAALEKACPTVSDIANAQSQMSNTLSAIKLYNMKLNK